MLNVGRADASVVAIALPSLLRGLRRERSLTQRALADLSGISARTIGDLECGKASAPRSSTLVAIADALEVNALDRARLLRFADDAREVVRGRLPPGICGTMVGREADIERIASALRRELTRIHTVVGAGGVGKTTLAVEIARRIGIGFPGGVVLVRLEDIADPDAVVARVLEGLGVPGLVPLVAVEDEPARLAVVDNFEHVVEAAAAFATLPQLFPRVCFLVTSRSALQVRNEVVHALEPLATRDAGRLFCEVARHSGLAAALDDVRRDELVARVCDALDGVPLAIELTVPLLRGTPLRDLERRVRERLPLHARGRRDVSKRHRSIATSLTWSFERLEPIDRDVAFALALFANGARIAWLAACLLLDEDVVRDSVARLATASLARLAYLPDGDFEIRTFHMVREFLLELAPAEMLARLRKRHAHWLLGLFRELLREPDSAADAIDARRSDAVAAIKWARGVRAAAFGVELILAICHRRRYLRGVDPSLLRSTAQNLRAFLDGLVSVCERERAMRTEALVLLASLNSGYGDHEAAARNIAEALRDERSTADAQREFRATQTRLGIQMNGGRYDDARASIAFLERRSGSITLAGRASFETMLTIIALFLDDMDATEAHARRCEAVARDGFPELTSVARAAHGYALALTRRIDEARGVIEPLRAIDLGIFGDDFDHMSLATRGCIAQSDGDDRAAWGNFVESFRRCIGSGTANGREWASYAALHLADSFARHGAEDSAFLAARTAAALRDEHNVPTHPVFRRYFGGLVVNSQRGDESGLLVRELFGAIARHPVSLC